MPRRFAAKRSASVFERVAGVEPFPFPSKDPAEGVPLCALHEPLTSAVGDEPADASARKHAEPDGDPEPPLPSELLAEKSSDADDGAVPQLVPRLASVGTPGEASAVEHVEAFVGSSAEPTPASDPQNDAVALAIASARAPRSVRETVVRLTSALADGPDVVGAGVDPSGADGLGWDADAPVGTFALVPGPLAVVDPRAADPGAVFELDAVTGSLDATVNGPALPGVVEADPPAVGACGSGRTSGCADNAGPSASAWKPTTLDSAITATSSSSFLIS